MPDLDKKLLPVCYLDVDDTLLRFPPPSETLFWKKYPRGGPADGAGAFLEWLVQHFEVRWLTWWAPSGIMVPDRQRSLAELLNVNRSVLRDITNPRSFLGDGVFGRYGARKIDGINLDEARERPFIWVEDEYQISDSEIQILKAHNCGDSWISCNVTRDPTRLVAVKKIIQERFNLPD